MVKPLKIYTDGASRGNPGPASCAYFIQKEGKIIAKGAKFLGRKTCNEAEYHGIIMALTRAKDYTNDIIYLHSDSRLAIRQLNGEYKVRAVNLRKLFNRVKSLLENFDNYKLFHLNRDDEFIKICDKMCNAVFRRLKYVIKCVIVYLEDLVGDFKIYHYSTRL